MSLSKFPLTADGFSQEEIEAATAVMRSGRYTMGEKVREFETALAQWMGVEHAIMVNSGSSANLLLVDSLLRRSNPDRAKLKPGDEVLVPALSWPTTVWPLVQLGLVPVFADVDPDTLAISLDSAQEALSEKTKALFLIHVLGRAAPMGKYVDFCRQNGLTLIEDCCESFGAFSDSKHVGSFGLGGTFSHFYSHHLTTMEGGTITTQDQELADDLRSMRAHGWLRDRSDREALSKKYSSFDPRFLFVMPGYNVRPLEIEAAIGLVQLRKMDEFLTARERLAQRVVELCARHVPWLEVVGGSLTKNLSTQRSGRAHSWMNLPFRLKKEAPLSLGDTKQILENHGVETRPIIAGNLSRHPACQRLKFRAAQDLSASDEALYRGFMIGCHARITEDQTQTLERAFEALGRKGE